MSLPGFGYTHPGSTSLSASSQLLMSSSAAAAATASTLPSVPTSCCENGRPIMTDPHTGQTVCSCQYGSGLLSAYSRVSGLADSVYGASPYATQGYMSLGTDPSAFYSPLNAHYDLKENADAWRNLTQPTACYPYDPAMAAYPYSNTYGGMDLNGAARRKNATRETTNTLKAWLYEHRKNPYPTKGEKIMLAIITKMTLTQVSTWFANARRRLKKENKMTWSPRNRCGDDDESGREKTDDEDMDDDDKEKCDDKDSLKKEKRNEDDDKSDVEDTIDPLKPDLPDITGVTTDLLGLNTPTIPLPQAPVAVPQPMPASASGQPKRLESPCSSSNDSGLSDVNGTLSTNSSTVEHSESMRPRIWSLAHVATSSTPNTSTTASTQDHNAPLNFSKMGHSFVPPTTGMRSWLDGAFSVGSSIFSAVPQAYNSMSAPQKFKDCTSVSPSLNGLSSMNSSILRPYPQLSSIYSPARDLTQRGAERGTSGILKS